MLNIGFIENWERSACLSVATPDPTLKKMILSASLTFHPLSSYRYALGVVVAALCPQLQPKGFELG